MILMREELIQIGIMNLARDEELAEETAVTLICAPLALSSSIWI